MDSTAFPAWLALAALALQGVAWVLWIRAHGPRPRSRPVRPAGETAGPRPVSWTAGLARTRGRLVSRLVESWRGPAELEQWVAGAEEALLTADVGVAATAALLEEVRRHAGELQGPEDVRRRLEDAVRGLMEAPPASPPAAKPHVILVVGVNGVGKTTTIGKLAHRYRRQGRRVLLVAADTFRAAAAEQLERWARRADADLVRHQPGGDPSAVAFDGARAALARGADVVIVDTAGRLHVKANLMQELGKIARTLGRQIPGAPHEILLVIDATTGQNALRQARVFHEAVPVTGVVLAKLDGTARGGVALAIRKELGLPIRYVGLGEGIDDLADFDAGEFARALFGASAEACEETGGGARPHGGSGQQPPPAHEARG